MRKTLVVMASLVMSLVMCVSFLGGCKLITNDNERNMNQVVATIQIADDAPVDKIYKKDIVMGYLNYGYYYEQSYGYTREQTINLIVNQLITTRVYVQNAIIKFNTTDTSDIYYGNVVNADKGTWDLQRYLTEDEIIDATYSTNKDINSLIDGYEESEEESVSDTLIDTVRAVPTDAANKEKELSNEEKNAYAIDTSSTTERRKAYNDVIKLLEDNELLGNYNGDIKTTTYYSETLQSYQENKILEKFEKCITLSAIKSVSFADLQKVYADNFDAQSQMTDAEFAEKLSSATAEDPVLIGKDGSYGYVYNLLLGANQAQTAEISEIKTTDIAKRAQERKAILDKITVKDLRSTWLLSGYDFDMTTKCFTGDYTFAKDAANSLPFYGEVTHLNADKVDEEDYAAKYRVDSVEEFTLDQFVKMMEQYVYGSTQSDIKSSADGASVYRKVKAQAVASEYDAKINELLFAFSTDDGSLNTYKGYAIEPIPDTGSETYVQEFADAGRELLQMQGNSYIMVGTDYGYHVMFFSQAFGGTEGFDALEKYLNYSMNADGDVAYWTEQLASLVESWDEEDLDTDNFLYKFFNSVSSEKVSKAITKVQNKLMNDHVYSTKGGVTRYPDTYADLLNA